MKPSRSDCTQQPQCVGFIKQSFKDIPGIDHGAASDVMYAVLFICRLLMISKDRLGGTTPERRRLSAEAHQP